MKLNYKNKASYFLNLKKELLGPTKVSKSPELVIITAQSAAGKSTLIKNLQANTALKKYVVIDSDMFRRSHPNYKHLINNPFIIPPQYICHYIKPFTAEV